MPTGLLKDRVHSCPKDIRLLGLDLGDKTIGLALSNQNQTIATPVTTVARTKFSQDLDKIAKVIRDYEVGGFILGYPLNMDGTEGPACDKVKSFADELSKYPHIVGINPWIGLWDERLSTSTVDDFLVEAVNMSRTKRKHVIDKLAAQHILQGALDYLGKYRESAQDT